MKSLSIWIAGLALAMSIPANSVGRAESAVTYEELMRQARELRLSGGAEAAEKIYSEILANNAGDTDALVGRGFCRLADATRLDEALVDFKRAIDLAPDYVDAYLGQALAYRRMGNRSAAWIALSHCGEVLGGDEEKLRYLDPIRKAF